MAKIYNEIILDMNPESSTFEEVLYEDSFSYSGDMMLCQVANMLMMGDTDLSGVSAGNYWFIGITEEARLIKKTTLDIDFTLTSLEFSLHNGVGVSGDFPGIIRVYQEGYKESAAIFAVTGVSHSTAAFNVEIKGDLGARIVIIDGWDPASSNPNNVCSFTGSITLNGKPTISAGGGAPGGSNNPN